MWSLRFGRSIGVAVAICVPAVVLAQSFPPSGFPQRFAAGDVLSAPALDAMRQAIVDLNTRLTRTGVGAPTLVVTLSSGRPDAIVNARADGVLTLVPQGSGFGELAVDVRVGSPLAARARDGMSTTVTLARQASATIATRIPAGNTGVYAVYWTSLEGPNAPLPTVQ